MQLVTLEMAKKQVALTHSEDDFLIADYISMASAVALNYIKSDGSDYLDTSETVDLDLVPFEMKAAVLWMVGFFYNNRGGTDTAGPDVGEPPWPVKSLLYHLRSLSMA